MFERNSVFFYFSLESTKLSKKSFPYLSTFIMPFATLSDTFFPDEKQTNASVHISKGLGKAEKAHSVLLTLHSFSCLSKIVMSLRQSRDFESMLVVPYKAKTYCDLL